MNALYQHTAWCDKESPLYELLLSSSGYEKQQNLCHFSCLTSLCHSLQSLIFPSFSPLIFIRKSSSLDNGWHFFLKPQWHGPLTEVYSTVEPKWSLSLFLCLFLILPFLALQPNKATIDRTTEINSFLQHLTIFSWTPGSESTFKAN